VITTRPWGRCPIKDGGIGGLKKICFLYSRGIDVRYSPMIRWHAKSPLSGLRAGLSQRWLAKLIGTTAAVICRLEDADYESHSLAMLNRIATTLNRRIEIHFVLSGGSGPWPDDSNISLTRP